MYAPSDNPKLELFTETDLLRVERLSVSECF